METKKEPYPSDLSDAEWRILEPLLPERGKLGRPPRYARRAVLNAIFYVVRSGCAWRLLPHDLPPWRLVYYYYAKWRDQAVWEALHEVLRGKVREQAGKKKHPPLRLSTLRALKQLGTVECADAMRQRRSWGERDIWPWTAWVCP